MQHSPEQGGKCIYIYIIILWGRLVSNSTLGSESCTVGIFYHFMYSICLSKNHSLPYLLQCRPTLKTKRTRFRIDERTRIGKDVWNDWEATTLLQISWLQHPHLQNRGCLIWSWTCTRLHKILYRLIIPKVLISWILSITKNKLLSNSCFYSCTDEISTWISQWKTEFE